MGPYGLCSFPDPQCPHLKNETQRRLGGTYQAFGDPASVTTQHTHARPGQVEHLGTVDVEMSEMHSFYKGGWLGYGSCERTSSAPYELQAEC